MPYQPNLKDVDLSYPKRIPYSIEYFFQNERTQASPWEISIEKDCKGFFERSTQPLTTRKMFCWGDGIGGNHWCDYLSQAGKGHYIEIQAGLAPTQTHTAVIDGNAIVSFTQFFGAIVAPACAQIEDWGKALVEVSRCVEHTLPTNSVLKQDKDYSEKATLPTGELLHHGGYYGGLENARRAVIKEKTLSPHLMFVAPPQHSEYSQWINVLNGKQLIGSEKKPLPYVTDQLWLASLEQVAQHSNATEETLFQYGVSLIENNQITEGEAVLHKLAENQNPWAVSTLAISAQRNGDIKLALKYFLKAYEIEKGMLDCSFAENAMEALGNNGFIIEVWDMFEKIPVTSRTETMTMIATAAAVKLEKFEFLELAFEKEYACIREGGAGLCDIWVKYMARKKCKEQNIPFTESCIDDTLTLPAHLNFRMFNEKKDV